MSPDPLPDFRDVLLLSRGGLDAAELAECHGVLCGMICGENGDTAQDFFTHLSALQLAVDTDSVLEDVLVEAFECTRQQLADEELRFNLWLPDDEQPLAERAQSLAQWCSGFLAGLGLGGPLPALSAEATEALNDLRQIARAGFSSPADPAGGSAPSEEDEQAFCEIVEYVRVVTLTLREELRGPGEDDRIH